jgi:dihydropyrimidinase
MNTDFCTFEGWEIQGRVESVYSRGTCIVQDGRMVGEPGRGRRVFRRLG